jgi:hypothetical protein
VPLPWPIPRTCDGETVTPIWKSGSVISCTTERVRDTSVIVPTRPPAVITGLPTASPCSLPLSSSTVWSEKFENGPLDTRAIWVS